VCRLLGRPRPLGFGQPDEHPSPVSLQTLGPCSKSGIAPAVELNASENLVIAGVLGSGPQERLRVHRCRPRPRLCLSTLDTPEPGVSAFNALDRPGEIAKRRIAREDPGIAGEPCRLVGLTRQRWERPARAGRWATTLDEAGFVDVAVEELPHEGGIAVARRP
jgi:hypothetical protein